ncbi:MAG: hypothetical protein KDD98_12870 [Sphingomonadaceae bacterium]|nr:hypothetical protein [Sphingomonadaceae bacterium]
MNQLAQGILDHPLLARLLAGSESAYAIANRFLARAPIWAAAILFVFALQAALTLSHWPWLDEWQALQIALQSPDQAALFENLSYEGHPPLWYWMLQAMAQLVPTIWVLAAIALLLGLTTQALILFKAPFQRAERLALALTEFILFEFNTISRSLTLGVMLIILALVLWRSRLAWLPIILLPLCDFLFGVISGIFMLLRWRRTGWSWAGFVLWLASSAFAAYTVIPAADMTPAMASRGVLFEIGSFLARSGTLFLPFQFELFEPAWNGTAFFLLAPIFWIGFYWFAWRQFAGLPAMRLLLVGFVLLCAAFSVLVYPLSPRHLMLIAILLISLLWIARQDHGRKPNAAFRLWIGANALAGLATALFAFLVPFDTAHIAARDLDRMGLLESRLIAFPQDDAQGIPALTGKPVEHPGKPCLQSFVRWDSPVQSRSEEAVKASLEQIGKAKGRSHIVTNLDLDYLPASLAQKVYRSPRGINGLQYRVYLIARDQPIRPPPTALCIPGIKQIRALPAGQ